MRLSLRTPGLTASNALREHLERRTRFALGRFGRRITSVSATVADQNGPRGGADKTCRIVAAVEGARRIVVEDVDTDLYAAIDRATGRLGRAVARGVERLRERPLRPVPATD